jgi:hypothetical protein
MWLFLGVNGGVLNSMRLPALSRLALRRLFAERGDEISVRATALAKGFPAFDTGRPEVALAVAETMATDPDPYVQGFGLMMRAAVQENFGEPELSTSDAREAYQRFELVGDHWGMGMAAQGIGQWLASHERGETDEWLRRGERHLQLVGATEDARSIRVLLDVQLALKGDPEAAQRLEEAAADAHAEPMDTGQARLGLAQLAWQSEQYDVALAHARAVAQIAADAPTAMAQVRIVFRVVALIIELRVAAIRPELAPDAAARAVQLLVLAGEEAIPLLDSPVLGSWALAGAELAAYRGEPERARELWSLGVRLGANIRSLFSPEYSDRLVAALDDEDGRDAVRARWRDGSVPDVKNRIGDLMEALLDQTLRR